MKLSIEIATLYHYYLYFCQYISRIYLVLKWIHFSIFNAIHIISITLAHTKKQGISNSNFGDAVIDQVLATTSQCGVFAFRENYHVKVLCDDGSLTFATYHGLDHSKKDLYDNLACKFVASCLIIKNSLSKHAHTYLNEQYYVNQTNYPNTMITEVVLITSFGWNSGSVGGGGDKDINKPVAILLLHLADDSDNNSNDNDGSVGLFESEDLNDGRASNDNVSIANIPATAYELENDNIINDGIVTDNDDGNNDNNNDSTNIQVMTTMMTLVKTNLDLMM